VRAEIDGGGEVTGFFRSSLKRESWLNMSASVVFARPVEDGCAGWAVVVGVGCGAGADVGGAEGGRGTVTGGVGPNGLVELGRFVHASSSKPLEAARDELDLGGGCADVEDGRALLGLRSCGEVVRWI
jgi:hypothetical protein